MTAAPYSHPYGPPPAQPPADPGGSFRLFAGILGVLAALLVIVGSFLPQTSYEQIVDGKTESSQTISAWSRTFAAEPGDEAKKFYEQTHVARYGIPLTAGAVVLLAGAGLAFAGARRSAAARTALVAGAAGVTAAVWMLGMDVSATLSYDSDQGTIKSHYATGTGFWLLLGGGIIALVTLVLAALIERRARVAAPGGPPAGPYQQQSRPYPVPPQQFGGPQPYPGYPASQPFPVQGPPSQPFPAQTGPQPPPYGGPASQPFPTQQPGDPYGGVTQAQQHPAQQEPTEPNYQLPPLHPPNT